ncbi:MAG TPA: NAD(+) diphosphatase [Rhodanobacteraceae bacterium]
MNEPRSSAARSHRNTFAALHLERAAERRDDVEWLATQRASSQARFLCFDKEGRVPVRDDGLVLLSADAVGAQAQANLLGLDDGAPVFLLRDPIGAETFGAAEWIGLREAGVRLPAAEAGLLAYARGLANWQDATRFCSSCGAALDLVSAGHRAACPQCGRLHFPRTDPAIIVIVEHDDACLLGRQALWRPHQYSTLAGFVEPGESLEDAVRREVREEAGVEVLDCDYHSSQPWPFPASLMLGFTAVARAREIRLADGELEDARWFTAKQIVDGVRSGALRPSSPLSISYRLIEHWLRARADVELNDVVRTAPVA